MGMHSSCLAHAHMDNLWSDEDILPFVDLALLAAIEEDGFPHAHSHSEAEEDGFPYAHSHSQAGM